MERREENIYFNPILPGFPFVSLGGGGGGGGVGGQKVYLRKYSAVHAIEMKLIWCVKHPKMFILVTVSHVSDMTSYHAKMTSYV